MALPSGQALSGLIKALLLALAKNPDIEIIEKIRLLANEIGASGGDLPCPKKEEGEQ
jgi:hypothetical protein